MFKISFSRLPQAMNLVLFSNQQELVLNSPMRLWQRKLDKQSRKKEVDRSGGSNLSEDMLLSGQSGLLQKGVTLYTFSE